ncbi:MAG: 30S ribosomal protein S20 [Proteobacteria bacterium]|nr:30S ribosomal protein S20 [Pseudomonadota bacterium]
MANIKSARKRARQSDRLRAHNMSMRTTVRSAIKAVKKAVAAGDKTGAASAMQHSQSVLDRVAAKRVLHPNAADRYKSRLAHAVKSMQ